MRRGRVALIGVVVGCALLSGCGGSDGTAAEAAVASAAPASASAAAPSATAAAAAPTPTPSMLVSAEAEPSPEPLTVDCLAVTPNIVDVNKKYNPYGGAIDTDEWVFLEVRMLYRNGCPKAVKAVKGRVTVSDAFGDTVFVGSWKETVKVPVGKAVRGKADAGYEFSYLMDEGQVLKGTPEGDLSATFESDTVIFADGTKAS